MKIFYALIALVLVNVAVAADANTVGGKIIQVVSIDDLIIFRIAGGTDTNRPACATTLRYAVHKDSAHAPLVVTAFATGKELGTVNGFGTCSLSSTSEDVRYLQVCPVNGCS